MSGNPTLRAEVLWCLHTAAKHKSLNSNEGISDLFQAMFPDSEIAMTFVHGRDKTGYIVQFGLAQYFKEQMVNSIKKAGLFILLFDESLNQATKKKPDGLPCSLLGGWLCPGQISWVAVLGSQKSLGLVASH